MSAFSFISLPLSLSLPISFSPDLSSIELSCREMSQESFIYSFVARGTMVLAEYTEFTGNFPAIAAQCLQKLPSSNSKFTYSCDHHTFNFLVEDGYGIFRLLRSLLFHLYFRQFLRFFKASLIKLSLNYTDMEVQLPV